MVKEVCDYILRLLIREKVEILPDKNLLTYPRQGTYSIVGFDPCWSALLGVMLMDHCDQKKLYAQGSIDILLQFLRLSEANPVRFF